MRFEVREVHRDEFDVTLTRESKRKVLWTTYFVALAAVFGYSYMTQDKKNDAPED